MHMLSIEEREKFVACLSNRIQERVYEEVTYTHDIIFNSYVIHICGRDINFNIDITRYVLYVDSEKAAISIEEHIMDEYKRFILGKYIIQ